MEGLTADGMKSTQKYRVNNSRTIKMEIVAISSRWLAYKESVKG